MTAPPTLTEADLDRLLYALKTDYNGQRSPYIKARDYLLGCLMGDAGLRVSEAVSLSREQGYINETPVRTLHLKTHNTKNNHSRTLPLSQRIQLALTNYQPHLKDTDPNNPLIWLFPGARNANHLTTRSVHRIVNNAAEMALNRPVNPHLLRHTFATRILRASNTAVAQQLLGHKSLSSTQVYVHPNQDDLTQAVDSLNKQPEKS